MAGKNSADGAAVLELNVVFVVVRCTAE